jgi:Protein of unknown function (DUF3455)
MKSNVRFDRLLVAAALAAVAALSLAQAVHAGPAAPEVPGTIAVEEGHKLFLIADAVGVQIHSCTVSGGSYGWSFVGPRATLFDANGKVVATHFGGPSWRATDGSLVKAALDKRVTVDPTAIDWLRLRVTDRAPSADGDRLFGTTFIQRLATTGGLAPAPESCNPGTVGTVTEVPYTAVYAFWKATAS